MRRASLRATGRSATPISRINDIQHDHHEVIVSTLHIHLDHHNCLEVLVVRGKAGVIKRIADELIAAKGVKHGKLTVTSSGPDLPS